MGKKVQNKTMIKKIKEKKIKEKKAKKDRIKNSKKFKDMSQKGKDDLLELIARDLGYIE